MINGLNFKWLWSNGDATANYNVEFTKGLTLRELVDKVLRDAPDEWGYFEIDAAPAVEVARFSDLTRVIEYRYGKIVDIKTELYEQVADKEIERLTASGGYTRMDYMAHIKPDVTNADAAKEYEQKAEFVRNHLSPLLQAANIRVASAKYDRDSTTGEETITVTFSGTDYKETVCVTADSLIALTFDVIKQLY